MSDISIPRVPSLPPKQVQQLQIKKVEQLPIREVQQLPLKLKPGNPGLKGGATSYG
jgi:hypothetical protein